MFVPCCPVTFVGMFVTRLQGYLMWGAMVTTPLVHICRSSHCSPKQGGLEWECLNLECLLHNLLSKTSMSKCKLLVNVLPFLKAILFQLLIALYCHRFLVEGILIHLNGSFKLWIVGNRASFFILGTSEVLANGNFDHIPNSLLSSRKKMPLCLSFTWVRGYLKEAKKISVPNSTWKMLVSFKNNLPLAIPFNLSKYAFLMLLPG